MPVVDLPTLLLRLVSLSSISGFLPVLFYARVKLGAEQ